MGMGSGTEGQKEAKRQKGRKKTGLREVAQISDGKFFRATDTQSLESIYHDIDQLEKSTVSVKKYQEYRDLFPICIMSGVGLVIGQILLAQTVWKKLP